MVWKKAVKIAAALGIRLQTRWLPTTGGSALKFTALLVPAVTLVKLSQLVCERERV